MLEIGSRNINGSVRPLFNGAVYLGIDTTAGPGVDETADGAHFQPGLLLDTVVCCEVLEHTESAADIIGNSLRILEPGGVLIVTCAAPPRAPHSAVDGGALQPGEYYQNIYPKQLQHWTEHTAARCRCCRMCRAGVMCICGRPRQPKCPLKP